MSDQQADEKLYLQILIKRLFNLITVYIRICALELMIVFIMPINKDYENMLLFTELLAAAVTMPALLRRFHDHDTEQTIYLDRNLLYRIHVADGTC